MSTFTTPSRRQHSLSYHFSVAKSTKNLPKINSVHFNTPQPHDFDSNFLRKSHKSLNFLEFPSLFKNEDSNEKPKMNKIVNDHVFLTDLSKNPAEILKLCNQSIFLNPPKKLQKERFKAPERSREVFKSSFNDLRKKAFRIQNLLKEREEIQKNNSLGIINNINEHFRRKSKIETNEKKASEIHFKNVHKARVKRMEFLISPERNKEIMDKIKEENLMFIIQLHNNKLNSIKKYASVVEKETDFQNKNFKALYAEFTKEFEAVLKK